MYEITSKSVKWSLILCFTCGDFFIAWKN